MNIDTIVCHSDIIIVTDRYGQYIANSLADELRRLNLTCAISDGVINTDKPHIILFAHKIQNMPKNYILMQLQQLNKSQSIVNKISIDIGNSMMTLDFSLLNFAYYTNGNNMVIDYQPMPIINRIMDFIPEYSYDVLFFGTITERRKKILDELSKNNFIVATAHDIYNENLYFHIKKAKIILNLHNYYDSIFETYKINEILQFNTLIISEDIADEQIKNIYENDIFFVDTIDDTLSNMNQLIDTITDCLKNFDNYIKNYKKNNIRKETIEKAYNLFSENLKRNLVSCNLLSSKILNIDINKIICLYDTPKELNKFNKFNESNKEIEYFSMIKHKNINYKRILNYKIIFENLLKSNNKFVSICLSSSIFPNNFNNFYDTIIEYFLINCVDVYTNINESIKGEDIKKTDLYDKLIFFHHKKYPLNDRETNFIIFSRKFASQFIEKFEESDKFDNFNIDKFCEENNMSIISNDVTYFMNS
jgi:hypothetical protein